MSDKRWTWNRNLHTKVAHVFDTPHSQEWCDAIESAPGDAIIGKILCVCAALEIAREALAAITSEAQQCSIEALDLLECWIDDPIDERFEIICELIFGKDKAGPEIDLPSVVFWALRTATSSLGNYEAGWALENACDAAKLANICDTRLVEIARRSLFDRTHS